MSELSSHTAKQAEPYTPKHFGGFVARFARPDETKKVYAFYNRKDRPATVYLRKEEVIDAQVQDKRFFIITNANDEIVAASTFYSLNNNERVDCVNRGLLRDPVRGTVYEIGSVLKYHDNELRGFFHTLLFGVPMLEIFSRTTAPDAPKVPVPDFVICTVIDDESNKSNTARLTGQNEASPLSWQFLDAAKELCRTAASTVNKNDPGLNRTKKYYRASVHNLPAIAAYFLDIMRSTKITNKYGDTLKINLNPLGYADLCGDICDQREYISQQNSAIGWAELGRLIGLPAEPVVYGAMATTTTRMSSPAARRPKEPGPTPGRRSRAAATA